MQFSRRLACRPLVGAVFVSSMFLSAVFFFTGCEKTVPTNRIHSPPKTKVTNETRKTKVIKRELEQPPLPFGLKVSHEPLGQKIDGHEVTQYNLTNDHGMTVSLIDYGATIVSVQVPDQNGVPGEVMIGFNDLTQYGKPGSYFGGVIGRYANRIRDGKFVLDKKTYQLSKNNLPNNSHHFHGGKQGFNHKMWFAEEIQEDDSVAVHLTYVSEDGEEGFPGRLVTTIIYRLTNNNELRMEYSARTDKTTHVNLTNHCYWNLAGGGTVWKHQFTLHTDLYLPVDKTFIPTGKKLPVKKTLWDFTTPGNIDRHLHGKYLAYTTLYEHSCGRYYVIRQDSKNRQTEPVLAARLEDLKSGRIMDVLTDQPGVQFAVGSRLDGPSESGICLSCQKYPDTPNQAANNFPTTRLEPGHVYTQLTIYRFSTKKKSAQKTKAPPK